MTRVDSIASKLLGQLQPEAAEHNMTDAERLKCLTEALKLATHQIPAEQLLLKLNTSAVHCDTNASESSSSSGVELRAGNQLSGVELRAGNQFHCVECGKVFKEKRYLRLHIVRYHCTGMQGLTSKSVDLSANFSAAAAEEPMNFSDVSASPQPPAHNSSYFSRILSGWEPQRNKEELLEPQEPIICTICGKGFKAKRYLRRHLKLHKGASDPPPVRSAATPEKEPRSYTCYLCQEVFPKKTHLKHHISSHKQVFKCDFANCEYNSTKPGYLQQHMGVHYGKFLCAAASCEERFFTKAAMEEHKVTHDLAADELTTEVHLDSLSDLITANGDSVRGLITADGDSVDGHVTTEDFVCEICQEGFPRISERTMHMLTHSDTASLHCSFEGCDFACQQSAELSAHQKTHSSQLAQFYSCAVEGCQFRSVSRHDLAVHKLQHTGMKWYRCRHAGCEYRSTDEETFKKHEKKHKSVKNYYCDHCPAKFSTKSQQVHHRRVHAEETPHVCQYAGCDYRAKFAGSLWNHKKKHLKNFDCEKCGDSFLDDDELKGHLFTHIDDTA